MKLISKVLAGEASDREKTILEAWINASTGHRELYREMQSTWSLLEPPEVENIPSVEEEWKKLVNRLDSIAFEQPSERLFERLRKFIVYRRNLMRPAWALAVVIIVMAGLFLLRDRGTSNAYQEVVTLNGQKSTIILADGSRVTLNSGSRLQFEKPFFGECRQVVLSGEAYFEVNPDKRPFIVEAGNARMTVLGTEFNVKFREGATSVIVKSGMVKVESELDNVNVILQKDQMSLLTPKGHPEEPRQVDAEHLLGWLRGKLVFEKTSLHDIVDELVRTFDVCILLQCDESAQQTLTATFDEKVSIETVLSSICLAVGAGYRKENEEYIIF